MAGSNGHYGFSTIAIHGGEGPDPATGAHNTPIYQTSTYAFPTLEDKVSALDGGFVYTRDSNPTTAVLEAKIAMLEGGEAALASSSGMGAITASILSVVSSGDHVVASDELYTWATTFFNEDAEELGIEVTIVDISDLDAVRAAIQPNTKLMYVEFLSNPKIKIANIPELAKLARANNIVLAVDNTFTSPYIFRPLEHGAHLSIQSATKYLSGHGDTLAGTVAGDKELIARAHRKLQVTGSCISPFNAWLVLRGIRTLELRMERHCENAMKLATFLNRQPEVEYVNYAGLESHPNHAIARDLTGGKYGGMLTFKLKGDEHTPNLFADALQLCDHAVSLGDVFTLVWPSKEQLVRVSVGCENADDIVADFEQALEKISSQQVPAIAGQLRK